MVLNIAGPEFDFAHVVHAVLEECEHRRRSFEESDFEEEAMRCAREKLSQVRAAYDEFGGSASYWIALEKEVVETVMPQYSAAALQITQLERSSWGVFRGGDIGARLLFALGGLVIGSIIIAMPFIPIFEDTFAFILTFAGFFYPDLKRYWYERAWSRVLNRLVRDAAHYQEAGDLHYMTRESIRDAFVPAPKQIEPPNEPHRKKHAHK